MLANLQHTLSLWLKEKTGLTAGVVLFFSIAAAAALLGFIFLCVSGYAWATVQFGPVFGGLATAGVFVAIAACSFALAASRRRQAQHRAALERASRTHGMALLLNPGTLQIAMQASRKIGWQWIIPIALIGFLATQVARERRQSETVL